MPYPYDLAAVPDEARYGLRCSVDSALVPRAQCCGFDLRPRGHHQCWVDIHCSHAPSSGSGGGYSSLRCIPGSHKIPHRVTEACVEASSHVKDLEVSENYPQTHSVVSLMATAAL